MDYVLQLIIKVVTKILNIIFKFMECCGKKTREKILSCILSYQHCSKIYISHKIFIELLLIYGILISRLPDRSLVENARFIY